MGFVDTVVDTEAELLLDDNGEKIFSHYADKDQITEALVLGLPIVALCGKIWIPHRNPDKYPICPRCKELYDLLFLP
jgi:hypothetical protein